MISNSIQLLVQDLDAACDPALTAMSKVGVDFQEDFHLKIHVEFLCALIALFHHWYILLLWFFSYFLDQQLLYF